MGNENALGEQMLKIVQDVEQAVHLSDLGGTWPPSPQFSMELLTTLASPEATVNYEAVIERLVADACDD
ncbi:hypothetical protein [Nonomuraea dietziae]|uniref:hypothetical protein n=1 Tax=Nonomuraea dietziae TaxID=65515 RepID=UPI00343B7D99